MQFFSFKQKNLLKYNIKPSSKKPSAIFFLNHVNILQNSQAIGAAEAPDLMAALCLILQSISVH